MVYVGSANTAAIMAQLPDHPHILLLYNDPWVVIWQAPMQLYLLWSLTFHAP